MSKTETPQLVEQVDESLFGSVIDSIDSFTRRLATVSDPTRLSILYTVYEYDEVTHRKLHREAHSVDSDEFEATIDAFLNENLIAKIPSTRGTADDLRYYRITRLGKDIIEYIIDKQNDTITAHYNTKTDDNVWTADTTE